MSRKGGLGKGLAALIPGGVSGAVLEQVPVNNIRPNPYQPREHFDEDSLNELAASIKEVGLLQPVLVRRTPTGYELVAGERRWRASRRAGLEVVPAIVREVGDELSLGQALVENLHRQDLNALEEAAAYQQLIEDFHLTHDDVATKVGKSRAAISNTLRLMQLPPGIQKMLADGSLSAGHARALLATEDRSFQEGLARRVVKDGLSVRATEDAVRLREDMADLVPGNRKATAPKAAAYLEAEGSLATYLGTGVKVTGGRGKRGKGRITIEFAGAEDLLRICDLITDDGSLAVSESADADLDLPDGLAEEEAEEAAEALPEAAAEAAEALPEGATEAAAEAAAV